LRIETPESLQAPSPVSDWWIRWNAPFRAGLLFFVERMISWED
jgi:hypothetical protein